MNLETFNSIIYRIISNTPSYTMEEVHATLIEAIKELNSRRTIVEQITIDDTTLSINED